MLPVKTEPDRGTGPARLSTFPTLSALHPAAAGSLPGPEPTGLALPWGLAVGGQTSLALQSLSQSGCPATSVLTV